MKIEYEVSQSIDPMTFHPRIGITINKKPFMIINLETVFDVAPNVEYCPF